MAQSESETVLTEHHETDNLDPRTDAPARPGTPVHIAPVQLGNITVPTPVVLSPMAGVTNWPFRVICEEYGPDGLYVAEMITARALVAHNPKALRLCHFAKSEKIRSLQLYGVNPSITEQAAKIVVDGNMADHVDLNFGCPVPKVTRRGGGSALPWKTDIFTELLQRVVAVCEPAGIPVTAKIFRPGRVSLRVRTKARIPSGLWAPSRRTNGFLEIISNLAGHLVLAIPA